MKHYFRILPLILTILLLAAISCRKSDKTDHTPGISLGFSTDTVLFDTVFTTVGSVTRRLIVYNPNQNKVSVSKITLSGGNSSSYRLNIDGIASSEVNDLEISGHDSIFIFIRVTVDPENLATPFVVSDSIRFELNGNQQYVKLVAWGRDAVFYHNEILTGAHQWDSTRARVIFGSLRVDTSSTLTILPGTKVYFHKDSYMAVSWLGTLNVAGTSDFPVWFRGDRLDPFYNELPGQWLGIFLERGSRNHRFENARIINGVYGVLVDKPSSPVSVMLTISNTIIRNKTMSGIYAFGTTIAAVNCVIGDCGQHAIDISYGGSYDFRHLTIGNYWFSSVRRAPSVTLSNYSYDTTGQKITNPLVKAYFGNCIVFGANDEEMEFDSVTGVPFEYKFENSLIRTMLPLTNTTRFVNCQKNKNPRFINTPDWNYQIDSISPAIDQGVDLVLPFDLRGLSRTLPPDLGAYEYIKGR